MILIKFSYLSKEVGELGITALHCHVLTKDCPHLCEHSARFIEVRDLALVALRKDHYDHIFIQGLLE